MRGRICRRWLKLAVVCCGLPGLAQTVDSGKRAYLARCAGCHGEDGSGGGHGPGILNTRGSRAAISDVIRNGLPATGMPAFSLASAEVEAIADFVWTLKIGRAHV